MARSRDKTRVTIADVATKAGVSRATVSRVMNGLSTVDREIAERVLKAAEELSYTPSAAARSLALGRSHTIGYIVPDLTNPAFHGAMRGLSLAAAKEGYRVLVADTAERVEEEPILAVESRRRCDALVLCAPRMPEEELRRLLPELAPVVLLNREPTDDSSPLLGIDWASGIRDLVRHLTGLGHRRIAYLAGPPISASNAARLRGFESFGSTIELVSIPCGAMFADGHAAAGQVLDSGATAVIAFNDVVALGLLGALHELGVEVPDRLSVAGFDDIPFAQFTSPALTTASVPQMELGELAWESLWAMLNGRKPERSAMFRPRLVARSSTGRARVD
ncbi:LacI family DNA-binding transcriptional regulator [Microlunatus sp. GCM10028923]|uniref:LacI family DNA-binding transcriptional regulator n=1 Tax=Microlunatus sp. GCM10028923 TaxID=3273400 RepID=UPI00361CF59D